MTNQELINYYADLLILQYRGKDKAYRTIQALAALLVMNQLITQVMNAYSLDSAVGVQLNVIGKYAGVSRNANDFSGPVVLGDDDYRTLIKVAILQNSNGCSLYDIQSLINIFFSGIIYVFDFQYMRMQYFLDSNSIGAQLAEIFINQGSLPKPTGVTLGATIYLPSIDGFYGFATNNTNAYNTTGFSTNAGFVGNGWFQNGDFL